ncbi:MAG TPA: hypothetical protein VK203_10335 [Nostocaceae cyanobacterium]|nr:hypothetical protein [Nostocaceae cyanobacterium]
MEKLNINITELLEIYNHVPHILARKATKVSLQEESLIQQNQNFIFLESTKNGNYWVVATEDNHYWLLPKMNFKIDSFKYDILKSLFDCEGYSLDDNRGFNVIQPAKVALIPTENLIWKLEKKGKLDFSNSITPTLETELDLANQKIETLTDRLDQVSRERDYFCSQTKDFIETINSERQIYQQQIDKILHENQRQFDALETQVNHKFTSIESDLNKIKKYLLLNNNKSPASNNYDYNKTPADNSVNNRLVEQSVVSSQKQTTVQTPNNYSTTTNDETVLPWVSTYNKKPSVFADYTTEIAETQESINQRRFGLLQPAVFQEVKKGKGTFWMLGKEIQYLIPKADFTINEDNLITIQTLFYCRGNMRFNAIFQLVKPGLLKPINTNQWQVAELGILYFY